MTARRTIHSILSSPPTHWVGDGFPVASVFSPQSVGSRLSPFILFDYAAPVRFDPARNPRGVDSHPHRGFETVTIVFQGELEHRDSAGNSGSIGPGDVQWMTAASGVLHEEKHSAAFTRAGGTFEVAQLWVNLSAASKMLPPRYQTLLKSQIPSVSFTANTGSARIIAGNFDSSPGAAKTFSPVILWDIHLHSDASVDLPIPAGFNAAIFLRNGSVSIHDSPPLSPTQLAILSTQEDQVSIRAAADSDLLLLAGLPINEPLATYGPFVMNTAEEIQQAIHDFRAGKFGTLAASPASA